MTEAARLAKVDFIVNVVENKKGEIVKAFAGDLEAGVSWKRSNWWMKCTVSPLTAEQTSSW